MHPAFSFTIQYYSLPELYTHISFEITNMPTISKYVYHAIINNNAILNRIRRIEENRKDTAQK